MIPFSRPDISDRPQNHTDRYRYRNNQNSYQRPHQQGERQVLPSLLQWKKGEGHRNTSQETSSFYEDQAGAQYQINSMGDVDHRQLPQAREGYPRIPSISPWLPDHPLHQHTGNRHGSYGQDRGQSNNQSASVEYTGHRPPASDHYGCNPTSVIDSSNSFSRSVDDTVDIIRKRLQNRNDPQHADNCQDNTAAVDQKLETSDNCQNQNEQPMSKRYQRQRNVTSKPNCAKIKDKIVHQLFKMDKEKIHKLMDNPSSSSKFEYAISSLITESQNSFNRHLRSAAEKSLCGSSTEFIENDNNTIYEDTFMKQMQCMLDPQDTVFLEDIKPFVMAEINKVLQLSEYEQNYNIGDEGIPTDSHDEHQNYSKYPNNNNFSQETYPSEDYYSGIKDSFETDYQRSRSVEPPIDNYRAYDKDPSYYEDTKPLFQRRQRTKSFSYTHNNPMSDTPYYGRETEEGSNENLARSGTPQDLFDANAEQFSEDDDPFAELDKQYHVAVDHDFIEQDDLSNPSPEKNKHKSSYTQSFKTEPLSPEKNLKSIDKDIKAQLHDMAQSPLKLSLPSIKQETKNTIIQCKQESVSSSNILPLQEKNENNVSTVSENTSKQNEPVSKEISKETDKTDPSSNLKSLSSNSRKRSTDQRPSHRKEKRKKSESCSSEPSKQILNKNIIINVNDCASKKSDKCENSKSIFNLFFSKDESTNVPKDNKTTSSNDKVHTEKHVKRKETITPKKPNDKDSKRKDSTSSNVVTSPGDNNTGDAPIKAETKTTLKPIDMFNDQPKKVNSTHQAHRNTAPTLSATTKVEIVKKHKVTGPLCKQLVRRHVAVQVIRKVHAKQTQTPPSKCGLEACQPKKKLTTKSTQTDMKNFDITCIEPSDALERMKEIDLEIQVLLQEKFKLYSSMEAKDKEKSSLQNLGMTVLKVKPIQPEEVDNETTEDNILSEDAIVNDFANMPVEELEQIALESVQQHEEETSNKSKRNRRRKVLYEESHSQSPVTIQKRNKSKAKSPNISLIEQIIEDDRPLEDIISLDDLEIPQVKTKTKKTKTKSSKKKVSKSKAVKPVNTFKYTIKECSVLIKRIDITPYLNTIRYRTPESYIQYDNTTEESITDINQKGFNLDTNTVSDMLYEHNENIIEDTVVNELSSCQFDMLDVSEDIVVGDNCEVKSLEDKEEITGNVTVPVCEDIILDNSQSSVEDAAAPVAQGGECKMYDYSADESLRRDSIIVSGNADAVLAVEVNVNT